MYARYQIQFDARSRLHLLALPNETAMLETQRSHAGAIGAVAEELAIENVPDHVPGAHFVHDGVGKRANGFTGSVDDHRLEIMRATGKLAREAAGLLDQDLELFAQACPVERRLLGI